MGASDMPLDLKECWSSFVFSSIVSMYGWFVFTIFYITSLSLVFSYYFVIGISSLKGRGSSFIGTMTGTTTAFLSGFYSTSKCCFGLEISDFLFCAISCDWANLEGSMVVLLDSFLDDTNVTSSGSPQRPSRDWDWNWGCLIWRGWPICKTPKDYHSFTP